ncbi:MAG: response regulator [Acidobacteria bacterium]|nr:response regulator [Acidobacteriota bacterium]
MGYKILLADDSLTVQKIISLTFKDEDIDVETVNNGDQAITRLHYMRPALIMADVSIPGKNGYEICEYVKSHPDLKNTPVILLVHAFEPFDEERARKVGADQFLKKPFQPIRGLISTVMNLIEPERLPERLEELEAKNLDKLDVVNLESIEVAGSEVWKKAEVIPGVAPVNNPVQLAPRNDIDHVLELDDVLSEAWGVAQQQSRPVPDEEKFIEAVSMVDRFGEREAVSEAGIPQRVIDEIVDRVVERLTAELGGSKLSDQIAAKLADRIEDLAARQHAAPHAARIESDSLLELDEV